MASEDEAQIAGAMYGSPAVYTHTSDHHHSFRVKFGRGLPTWIAIDALVIHVKAPCRILRIFIYELSHIFTLLFPSRFRSPKSPNKRYPPTPTHISDPLLGNHHCNGYCPTSSKLHSWPVMEHDSQSTEPFSNIRPLSHHLSRWIGNFNGYEEKRTKQMNLI